MSLCDYRGWINQPSTLQPLHRLHGERVIVNPNGGTGPHTVQVRFIRGPIHSMVIDKLCVSRGWPHQANEEI
jgi:hypothetical protein